MHQIQVDYDFNAPAGALWALIEDFGNIQRWWPAGDPAAQIDRVVIEGSGVGQIRHIYNASFPDPLQERLDFIDPHTMTFKLSLVGKMPMDMTHYQATGYIESLPGNRCRLNYLGEFATGTGEREAAEAWLRAVYGLMYQGLSDTLARAA